MVFVRKRNRKGEGVGGRSSSLCMRVFADQTAEVRGFQKMKNVNEEIRVWGVVTSVKIGRVRFLNVLGEVRPTGCK